MSGMVVCVGCVSVWWVLYDEVWCGGVVLWCGGIGWFVVVDVGVAVGVFCWVVG